MNEEWRGHDSIKLLFTKLKSVLGVPVRVRRVGRCGVVFSLLFRMCSNFHCFRYYFPVYFKNFVRSSVLHRISDQSLALSSSTYTLTIVTVLHY